MLGAGGYSDSKMSHVSYSVSAPLLLSSYPGSWLPPPLFTSLRSAAVAGGAQGAVTGARARTEKASGNLTPAVWDCFWNQSGALSWRWQEVDSRQKERPFTSPPRVKLPIPNQWEVGAIESSNEYR